MLIKKKSQSSYGYQFMIVRWIPTTESPAQQAGREFILGDSNFISGQPYWGASVISWASKPWEGLAYIFIFKYSGSRFCPTNGPIWAYLESQPITNQLHQSQESWRWSSMSGSRLWCSQLKILRGAACGSLTWTCWCPERTPPLSTSTGPMTPTISLTHRYSRRH